MKTTLTAIALAPGLLFSVPVRAAFNEGITAYKSGNYAAAYREFETAAQRGGKFAQVMAATMCLEGAVIARDA